MTEDICYARVIIEGELTTLSDLHVGAASQPLPMGEDEPENHIMRDCLGQPFIPGSSLRGLLRAIIGSDSNAGRELFGQARLTDAEKAGKLRVYDAHITQCVALPMRTRIEKNPVTGAAEDKHLIHDRVVPRGSRFLVSLQGDGLRHSHVEALLQALQGLNGAAQGRLGSGKSIGRGRLNWRLKKASGLDSEALNAWLYGDDSLEKARWTAMNPPDEAMSDSDFISWRLRLVFDEPVLVNDPSIVSGEKGDPDLRYLREDGKLLVTGASLKGLFRGRIRRILMTMTGGDEDMSDKLIGKMFGSGDGISQWWFDDLLAPVESVHEQAIIAVDRFTGGVKDGAMLNLEAAVAGPSETQIHARADAPGWQQLLWLYALRDAMEGDLNIGWGAARGFGAFRAEYLDGGGESKTWEEVLDKYRSKIAAWDNQLQDKLTEAEGPATGEEDAA